MQHLRLNLSSSAIRDLNYKLEKKLINHGEMIQIEGQVAGGILFVVSGVVEAFTECDGHEFILDWLYRGSVINHRSFFIEDTVKVNYRAKGLC